MERLKTRQSRQLCNLVSLVAFFGSLAIYWLTADRDASYWDCPEYVTLASLLEVGHPPGNPVWMLAMRVATMPFPQSLHATVVNFCSGLFTAGSIFFLVRIIYLLVFWVMVKSKGSLTRGLFDIPQYAALSALGGAMCLAVCDSVWFSAVEAEVYAFSLFLTSLSLWLMLKWAAAPDGAARNRLLVLLAYVMGLSLGVHQLNLLIIPVCGLIYVYRRHPRRAGVWPVAAALTVSMAIVGIVLLGLMPGALSWAEEFELFAVNRLELPMFSGAIAYIAVLVLCVAAAEVAIERAPKWLAAVGFGLFVWLSGAFLFHRHIIWAGILSAGFAFYAAYSKRMSRASLSTMLWMGAMVMTGYFSFAMILIRGVAAPPVNEGAPTDIFALSEYVARSQYGSTPLFHGPTPYSKPMSEEIWREGSSLPDYSRYLLADKGKRIVPTLPDARLYQRSRMMTAADSLENSKILHRQAPGYLIADHNYARVTTPELDMWLPRITSGDPADIACYADWAGMTPDNMERVKISETVDSLGVARAKIGADGQRGEPEALRPTYLQNLRYLATYQVGYMYFRYLLWNFMGRQNDIPSTGEIEHGNFITGITPVDNLMLGPTELMPPRAWSDNPGHHVYYGIPLLAGIIGILFLARGKMTSRRVLSIILLFFLMTGVAIVLYLNQTPGEPRERDYTFLGSYMAFSMWISFGILAVLLLVDRLKIPEKYMIGVKTLLAVALPLMMGTVNFASNIRLGRGEPLEFATDILETPDPTIIFTRGDNFTFPLWYARETHGVGRENCVIDVSYLSTPGYVVNLMKEGEDVIRFIARPGDVAYGAYAFTKVAPDADTTAVPLADALRELYSSREGAPQFRHCRATLPWADENGVAPVINLREFSSGGLIPFRKLMLLDILAANTDSLSPKRMVFLNSVSPDFYAPILPFTVQDLGGRALDIHASQCESRAIDAMRLRRVAEKRRHIPVYADPVIEDMTRRRRGELVISARKMIGNEDIVTATKLVEKIERDYPYDLTPPGSFAVADTTFHEGMEYVEMLMALHSKTGHREFLELATLHARQAEEAGAQWMPYYTALSPGRRSTVSGSTRRLLSTLQRARKLRQLTDSLLQANP